MPLYALNLVERDFFRFYEVFADSGGKEKERKPYLSLFEIFFAFFRLFWETVFAFDGGGIGRKEEEKPCLLNGAETDFRLFLFCGFRSFPLPKGMGIPLELLVKQASSKPFLIHKLVLPVVLSLKKIEKVRRSFFTVPHCQMVPSLVSEMNRPDIREIDVLQKGTDKLRPQKTKRALPVLRPLCLSEK